jgi:Type II secretory pathway, component ExeA (predicted ATPase)
VFLEYYELTEQPFGVTPDPRYLYLTPTHCEAMASIMYGLMENRGFTALIAAPGMGKTTLLFDLLQRCSGSFRTAFLFQFQCSPEGLLRSLLTELGVADDTDDFTRLQEKLNQAILAEARLGKRIAIVIDEAQNFSGPVLEVLRMLSNFESSREKLIHIILAGQPQLAEILLDPLVVQLRQRISIAAVLKPLDAQQTRDYIDHRLRVAGYSFREPIFSESAYALIARQAGGIPRNINNICFNAMSLGCATTQRTVGRELVMEVARDLSLERRAEPRIRDHGRLTGPQERMTRQQVPRIPAAPPPSSGFTLSRPARPARRGLRFTAAVTLVAGLCAGSVLVNQHLQEARRTSSAAAATDPQRAASPQDESKDTVAPLSQDSIAEGNLAPVDDSSTAAPLSAGATERPEGIRMVKVQPKQTLYDLCMSEMGQYDDKIVKQIRHLNPWMRNPKQIRAGQVIRMPVVSDSARFAGDKHKLLPAVATIGEER